MQFTETNHQSHNKIIQIWEEEASSYPQFFLPPLRMFQNLEISFFKVHTSLSLITSFIYYYDLLPHLLISEYLKKSEENKEKNDKEVSNLIAARKSYFSS